jgi:hypothetical protein
VVLPPLGAKGGATGIICWPSARSAVPQACTGWEGALRHQPSCPALFTALDDDGTGGVHSTRVQLVHGAACLQPGYAQHMHWAWCYGQVPVGHLVFMVQTSVQASWGVCAVPKGVHRSQAITTGVYGPWHSCHQPGVCYSIMHAAVVLGVSLPAVKGWLHVHRGVSVVHCNRACHAAVLPHSHVHASGAAPGCRALWPARVLHSAQR